MSESGAVTLSSMNMRLPAPIRPCCVRNPAFSTRTRPEPSGSQIESVGVVPSEIHCVVSLKLARYTLAPSGVECSTALRANRSQSEASVESFGRISVARLATIQALSYCARSANCLICGIASVRTQRARRIGAVENQAIAATAAPAPIHASARPRRARCADGSAPLGVAMVSMSASNSSAVWKRCAGSFSRHLSTVRCRENGTSARVIARGDLVRCALITDCGVPVNGGCPSSISYASTPTA